MSLFANRTALSLVHMTKEMLRKDIELGRIVKTSALLTMSGVSLLSIDEHIVKSCIENQFDDGGFIGITDTIWSICLLQQYKIYAEQVDAALAWLQNNAGKDGGFGRSPRDMQRIPVTGLAIYLLPQMAHEKHFKWLEKTWLKERNSLTYKAAYTLIAFSKNSYTPEDATLIQTASEWLASQQEENGGFAPWRGHPVGANIYCTAIGVLGLLSYDKTNHHTQILRAYNYMKTTQLLNGLWPYHELEDGASWGLYAISQVEEYLIGAHV